MMENKEFISESKYYWIQKMCELWKNKDLPYSVKVKQLELINKMLTELDKKIIKDLVKDYPFNAAGEYIGEKQR